MAKLINGQWVEDEENKEESAELNNAPKLSDNAEAFEEWKNNNADYQSLVKNYANAGDNAAKDVIAQISARTGGYASSYAARAATNAAADAKANAQLQLQEIARSRYNEDVADARNRVASFIAGGGDPNMIDDNILIMSGYSRGELDKLSKEIAADNTVTKSAYFDTVAANAKSTEKDYGTEAATKYINDSAAKGYITEDDAKEIIDLYLGDEDTIKKAKVYDEVFETAETKLKDEGKVAATLYLEAAVDAESISKKEAAKILISLGGPDPDVNKGSKEVKFKNNDGADRWSKGDNITLIDNEDNEYGVQIAGEITENSDKALWDDVNNYIYKKYIKKNDVFSKGGKLYLWTGEKLFEIEHRTNNIEKHVYNPASWFSKADEWDALKKVFGDIG